MLDVAIDRVYSRLIGLYNLVLSAMGDQFDWVPDRLIREEAIDRA